MLILPRFSMLPPVTQLVDAPAPVRPPAWPVWL